MVADNGVEMVKFGIGQSVRRKEDIRFLTGDGRFTDDLNLDGQTHAWFVRSPVAHARIADIELSAAQSIPGVIAIFTGRDITADPAISPLPCLSKVVDRQGREMYRPPRPALCGDRVRFVGDLVAMVVADTRQIAMDAAEALTIDYEDLDCVVDTGAAVASDAAVVWPDCPGNVCVHWENSDPAEIASIFETAPHVAEVSLVNNRLIANPMEPRVALADFDPVSGASTLHCPSQGTNRMHRVMTQHVLDLPSDKLRIQSGDVGGGFGVRSKAWPEQILAVWASRKLRRPIKWRGDRNDVMVSDNHARDHVTRARLAMDSGGHVLGMWVDTIANMGAYLMENGPIIPTMVGQRSMGTVYRIPALYHSVRCVFTNTTPVDSYRGAGRPETVYLMERLMDMAAHEIGLDPVEIRRRNLIPESAMPYTNSQDVEIDSGEFESVLDNALAAADWDGFEARRAESALRGRHRGIGVACSLECSGGMPEEEGRVRLDADGKATVFVGTFSQGQGHETVFPQIVAERLGIPFDNTRWVGAGDTTVVPFGFGTSASRSALMGGMAVAGACDRVVEAARPTAGRLLQHDAETLVFEAGAFKAHDGSASVGLAEAIATEGITLDETFRYKRGPGVFNYPNGCHVAEVEIDPETGAIEIQRFTAVDDNGVVLNPMIVHGQAHGAIVQGIGQALMEHVVYDSGTGQLFTASFLDYAMPRAGDIPDLYVSNHVVPCLTNELGVKGAGEGGCCAAPPAIAGAVTDALGHLGIRHINMPFTPERVWKAIRNSEKQGGTG
jgi:carbon-monoxide dehydrogenase large subunit